MFVADDNVERIVVVDGYQFITPHHLSCVEVAHLCCVQPVAGVMGIVCEYQSVVGERQLRAVVFYVCFPQLRHIAAVEHAYAAFVFPYPFLGGLACMYA